MKPSKHNNPDSWRRDDVNLRRALQQRNSNLPLLPEGFADRLMERFEAEEATTSSMTASAPPAAKTKRRHLWPIVATALSTAALLALVFILNRQSSDSQQALARDVEEVNEAVVNHGAYEAYEAYEANETNGANGAHETNEPAIEPAQPTDTATTTSPEALPLSPVDLDRLDHLLAEATKPTPNNNNVRNARETESKRQPMKLALAVNIGTDGGINSTHDEATTSSEPPIYVSSKPANYYFPAGNGYTYAYSSFSTWDKDGTDGKDVTAGKDATQGTSNIDLTNYWEAAVQYANSLQPVDDSHHHLPVTFGVSIGIPLNQRFTLESGITYTRLVSTFDHGTQASYEHSRQQVHYLGIPVRAQVLIFDRRHWNIYASLGGSIELPVSTLVTHRTITSKSSESLPDTHPTAPTQFAIGGGLGVQYSITRHIGIYAEPQLQWFIPTDSELKTYRTEHPLRFVPSLGLRWTL